jgi:ArsR family transcriptional regulator, arsenate/arsenite/antimonite-responsive transcriptional repressor
LIFRTVGVIFARTDMTRTKAPPGVDRIFRAFSDRTRLRILSLLKQGELCVGDLVAILKVPQPKVSRHLAYLRHARLVKTRESGLWIFYSLARAETPFHRKMIECLGACFGDVPEIARDAGKARALRKSGGCCPDNGSCGR